MYFSLIEGYSVIW